MCFVFSFLFDTCSDFLVSALPALCILCLMGRIGREPPVSKEANLAHLPVWPPLRLSAQMTTPGASTSASRAPVPLISPQNLEDIMEMRPKEGEDTDSTISEDEPAVPPKKSKRKKGKEVERKRK
jgi:hypothetical protein